MSQKCHEVLVVEDDRMIQMSMRLLLETEGYAVNQAMTGKDARDFLEKNDLPCLVLLDLMLPEISGEELLAGYLASEKFKDLPVVIISAASDAPQVAQRYGKRLLKKPIELDVLLQVIAESCARRLAPVG